MTDRLQLFTIGHSTRAWEEFAGLLEENQIRILADVRRLPGSRRYPHFNQGEMRTRLQECRIEYVHLEALGGRREPLQGSINAGWRNRSFRGYADHMATSEFRSGIDRLLELCQNGRVGIMCAEAVPWHCHRTLISDYLACMLELEVYHILSAGKVQPHSVTDFAQAAGGRLVYPASRMVSQ
jgi:uncharacterized protein (DUF488 family)